MEPIFEIGQKVVCVDSSGKTMLGNPSPLIEGKVYIVENPTFVIKHECVYIKIYGVTCGCNQYRFVPIEWDNQADEEIREALNESLKVKA